ncbi:hypothetical protein SERLA73DRAFT_189070 [Serpula lacrymans var. lacrymans S7.3]|uniref:Uncharacterized protein n=2 Tax=Serpula lacrymans var. lacrymans TaxID=341189 RepID=F8QCS8_SERL3|nr:uncharacterized protein SERLADRAFT_374561 [Serpula lacrymans var. lacrymans S7.9]EGN93943.1 hypothetical protein SERLA73DRAFT_189070 [Serpula lacrymans var. lacrymans S7.3]EGO19312.1 hypothetical protein SERLADRAFT_374561 [Serpula lacrymans var. lacrymans S7.9]
MGQYLEENVCFSWKINVDIIRSMGVAVSPLDRKCYKVTARAAYDRQHTLLDWMECNQFIDCVVICITYTNQLNGVLNTITTGRSPGLSRQ